MAALVEHKVIERKDGKAFVHQITWDELKPQITWDELKPHIPEMELDEKETKQLALLLEKKYRPSIYSFEIPTEAVREVMTTIVKNRQGAELKKGDIVKFSFINMKQDGICFWDGEKVIHPYDDPNSDYFGVPSIFPLPEFPMDYWCDIGVNFIGWSQGDFYLSFEEKNIKTIKEIEWYYNDEKHKLTVYRDEASRYCVVSLYDTDEERGHNWQTFLNTHRGIPYYNMEGDTFQPLINEYIDADKTVVIPWKIEFP